MMMVGKGGVGVADIAAEDRDEKKATGSGGSKLGYVHLFICTLYAMRGLRGDDVYSRGQSLASRSRDQRRVSSDPKYELLLLFDLWQRTSVGEQNSLMSAQLAAVGRHDMWDR
jgi:hypothetical protein